MKQTYDSFRVKVKDNKYKEDEAVLTWGNDIHQTRLLIPKDRISEFIAELNCYIKYQGAEDES